MVGPYPDMFSYIKCLLVHSLTAMSFKQVRDKNFLPLFLGPLFSPPTNCLMLFTFRRRKLRASCTLNIRQTSFVIIKLSQQLSICIVHRPSIRDCGVLPSTWEYLFSFSTILNKIEILSEPLSMFIWPSFREKWQGTFLVYFRPFVGSDLGKPTVLVFLLL